MPELYGQPYKWELRKKIEELQAMLRNEREEHQETRRAYQYVRCKVAELEAKIERMEQKARDLIAEATEDVSDKVGERVIQALTTASAERWAALAALHGSHPPD
jgi:chromosome segregation ATPase